MFGTLKRKGLTLLIIASSLLFGCSESTTNQPEKKEKSQWNEIHGATQGTTYSAILDDPQGVIKKEDLDSILHNFDLALSTYMDNSAISKVNDADTDTISFSDQQGYLEQCYNISRTVFKNTDGAFDPSVFPLVKAWGFFKEDAPIPTQSQLDSLLNSVGFGKNLHQFIFSEGKGICIKSDPSFRLDFNAIAQGYSVDVLADYVDSKGIKNYYLEIGGEIVVKGTNRENVKWRIGIDSPNQKEEIRVLDNVVNISDKALATSGNYRKFYIKDGVKYAHTINPKSGAPVQHSLLSASVIAETCAEADAYATAFMVMGVEKSMDFVQENQDLGLDIYLLYDDGTGAIQRRMTEGFEDYLK